VDAALILLDEPGVEPRQLDHHGTSPMFCAAASGHADVVDVLVRYGAKRDLNHANARGQTPLFAACEYGHARCAAALIAHGAHVDAADADGWTPLFLLAQRGDDAKTAQLLVDAGASITHQTADGRTPLDVCNRHTPVFRQVLQHFLSAQ